MIIISGTRHYGRIDEREGQFAVTRYFHLYYLPLVPLGTRWVTREAGGQLHGHAMRVSARSVAAGYARIWGAIAVVGGAVAIASGALAGLPIALAGGGAAAGSWAWRRLRRDRDRLRSDFHLLAYGTRCDPLAMTDAMAAALREGADARWATVSGGRTPEDVARLGTTDLQQAVFAYGVLRLAARTAPGPAAAAARATSEALLARFAGADVTAIEGGPYRAPALDAGPAPRA